ncbi:hypothetical protein [Streptomyces sp. NBC_01803]|uniref:hypothetical protein n=1 Tax=Streptomyces sp. NBC_01803 TaxID=2975946 RepID=UPI002DD9EC44|nr:hypothetical protein [Streptomyces sp. NBC_01803]WSA45051.1 hypothetical protein OIE51_13025 [Streptomyces sp. NBC_01803]
MVRKKVEGDENQRRAWAREAERVGELPSGRGTTTGASKQRTHVSHRSSLTHDEKTEPLERGKQRSEQREVAAAREADRPEPPVGRTFTGRGRPEYGPEHEKVFQALGDAERRHGGEAVYAQEIARTAGMPEERTRVLLHDLVSVHRLATELQRTDQPDLGPRYETKPGR